MIGLSSRIGIPCLEENDVLAWRKLRQIEGVIEIQGVR